MKIICPECQKENNIVVKGGINCKNCQKPLDDYRFIKPLIPAFMLIALTFGGSRTYEHFTKQNRYPVEIEYAIIDQCISSYDEPIKYSNLKNKRKLCINALEQTQKDFSYSDFKKDKKGFIDKFRQHSVTVSLIEGEQVRRPAPQGWEAPY